jgi:hypothetical protein
MNLGQSMLAAMALVVITFLVVSANRIIIQSRQDELKGEAYNQAGEIASELINEAMKKKYDDPTVTHRQWVDVYADPATRHFYLYSTWVYYKLYDFYSLNWTTDFTAIGSLGPSIRPSGFNEITAVPLPDRSPYKSIANYDDFDDYNGYSRIVDTPIMTGFVVNCTVIYLASATLLPATNPTFTKKLTVKVSQPIYLPDGLTFSTTMTYGQ